MIPWELLGRAPLPGDDADLVLYRRDDEYSMRIKNSELMNSRSHGSEEALGELGCAHLTAAEAPHVLIGGLGMGYTAAAVLKCVGPAAVVVVAELVPEVVTWNQQFMGHLAGHPLRDPRVSVKELDVGRVMEEGRGFYDAILLDVDNGPQSFSSKSNQHLYTREGLKTAFAALRPNGVLGMWSAGPDLEFSNKLRRAGFTVEEMSVRGRGRSGGHHTIWLGFRKH